MSKKKLLSESQVRRFMGLAGMKSSLVSNALKEMYHMKRDEEEEEEKMEEAMYSEEEPAADDEMPDEAPMPEPEGMDEPAGGGEVELSPEDIKAARDAVEKLLAPLEAEMPKGDEEPMPEPEGMDEPDDEPMPEPDDEEQEVMEALSGIDLQLNEDELVQEVAKRVAKRLLSAKKAQQQLDEALGRKK